MTATCPRCKIDTAMPDQAFFWLFLVYRPYVCAHCESKFRPAGLVRPIFFLLGVGGLGVAWFLPELQRAARDDPDIQVISISVVALVTIVAALILTISRRTKIVPEDDPIDVVMHFISHWILPVSLVVSAVVAYVRPLGM